MLAVTSLLALAASALATPLYTPASSPPQQQGQAAVFNAQAPIHSFAIDQGAEAVKDSYIVVMKPSTPSALLTSHIKLVTSTHGRSLLASDPSAGIHNVYRTQALQGYAGKFSAETLDDIRADPAVDFVERDSVVRTQDVELGAPWGLARVSHRPALKFGTFNRYEYDSTAGEGVDVYVVDTGIYIDHPEFEGRASWGKTIPKNDLDIDGNGHGTHCAGTIASKKYGVAKKAHVIAVKVLGTNGSGSMSDVVDGVLYAADQAAKKAAASAAEYAATGYTAHRGSVASMSLGGGKSPALDKAVNAAVTSGLHFAVAAGNDNRDACNYSPAAAELAITVGASTLGDERAYFSNHGKCVDVLAPGLSILSTWIPSEYSNATTNTISGTSMATPHVAGMLAYYLGGPKGLSISADAAPAPSVFSASLLLSKAVSWLLPSSSTPALSAVNDAVVQMLAPVPGKPISPAKLKAALLKLATQDAITGDLPAGTPNLLIFNNFTTSR